MMFCQMDWKLDVKWEGEKVRSQCQSVKTFNFILLETSDSKLIPWQKQKNIFFHNLEPTGILGSFGGEFQTSLRCHFCQWKQKVFVQFARQYISDWWKNVLLDMLSRKADPGVKAVALKGKLINVKITPVQRYGSIRTHILRTLYAATS